MLEGWQVNVALSMLSALPFNAQDSTDDLSGTGINQDRWNILGSPSNIVAGTAAPIPCFGVTGSKFATAAGNPCMVRHSPNGSSQGNPGFRFQYAVAVHRPRHRVRQLRPILLFPSSDANATGIAALGNFGCYFQNGTAIVPSAQGTYGDMGRDVLRGTPFPRDRSLNNEDVEVQRNACLLSSALNSSTSSMPWSSPTQGNRQHREPGGAGNLRLLQFHAEHVQFHLRQWRPAHRAVGIEVPLLVRLSQSALCI